MQSTFSFKSLVYKALFWLPVTLLPVYLLAPTLLGLKEKRLEAAKTNQTLPWYLNIFPENELNLGLDLQGGLYLELEVDLDSSIKHQIQFRANEIQKSLLAKDSEFNKTELTVLQNNHVRVIVPANQKQDLLTKINTQYGANDFTWQTNDLEIFFEITADKQASRQQALETIQKIENFSGQVSFSHAQKYLAISFGSRAEKAKILELFSAEELKKSFVLQENKDDVSYLGLSEDYLNRLKNDTLSQAKSAVENRIDRFGVAEAVVSIGSTRRLILELPGAKDPQSVIDIIQKTGKLEFRLLDDSAVSLELETLVAEKKAEFNIENFVEETDVKKLNTALAAKLPQDTEILFEIFRHPETKKVERSLPYLVGTKVYVTGDMLSDARVDSGQTNQPVVAIAFNKIGTKEFADFTEKNVGRISAIVLDNQIMSTPQIQEAISGGQATISLGRGTYQFLQKEALDLALILREGSLPARLTIATKNIIGPSLGKESIEKGITSLVIAAIAVIIFMFAYYRVGGLIANLALTLNILYIFAILCLLQASLTLPGIAGIVLTLGMAVDANVIIFERMREEMRKNKDIKHIIHNGYENAMSAIVDGNITTMIAGLVLFTFGTGPIKGFATTLMIGILTTMFCSVFLSKLVYYWLADTVKIKKLRL